MRSTISADTCLHQDNFLKLYQESVEQTSTGTWSCAWHALTVLLAHTTIVWFCGWDDCVLSLFYGTGRRNKGSSLEKKGTEIYWSSVSEKVIWEESCKK